MSHLLRFGLAASLALAGGAVSAAEINLKLAHVAPTASSYQKAGDKFAAHAKELTKGRVEVTVIGGGTLGDVSQLWAQTRAGAVDLHLIDVAGLVVMREGRPFSVLSQPYLFKDLAHWHRYLESGLFKEMMTDVEKAAGIAWVGYLGDRTPRALSTTKTEIRKPEDLKGLKLRLFENPIVIEAFKRWGANPTPLKAPEVYNALQTGLVEGQDNGVVDTVAFGVAPIQKYFIEMDYMMSGIGVWMNGAKWAGLPDDVKAALTEAAKRTAAEMKVDFDADVKKAYEALKAAGTTVVTPDREAFRAALGDMVKEADGKRWPEGLYGKIAGL